MKSSRILESPLSVLLTALENKTVEAADILTAFQNQITHVEPHIHAFITITKPDSFENQPKNNSPNLYGIPIGIKDNICVKNVRTTSGSKILEEYYPPYDATVIKKIREAHGNIAGKTNLDEFGMGSSTENSAFFPTHNPWDISRVPGGSSGGSAAAVAAREVPVALGSDTGGSIRCPASYCGVTGLKPTYGRVSRYGLIAYACSLEQIGPIGKTADDCRFLLSIIEGQDPLDATTHSQPIQSKKPKKHRPSIGIPRQFMNEGVALPVLKRIHDASDRFQELGYTVSSIDIPALEAALPAYYIIAMSEASSNLARFDGIRYGPANPFISKQQENDFREAISQYRNTFFGEEVKRRILLGSHTLSAGYFEQYYAKALKVRTLIRQNLLTAFNTHDFLIGPTMPDTAFPLGSKSTDPLAMYLTDIFTVPINLAGVPALSLPCGFHQGLPIGLQIIGPPWKDKALLELGKKYQEITNYHQQFPSIS